MHITISLGKHKTWWENYAIGHLLETDLIVSCS